MINPSGSSVSPPPISSVSPSGVQLGIMPTASTSTASTSTAGRDDGLILTKTVGAGSTRINVHIDLSQFSPRELENPEFMARIRKIEAREQAKLQKEQDEADVRIDKEQLAKTTYECCCCSCKGNTCCGSCCYALDILCDTSDINPPECGTAASCSYVIGRHSSCLQKGICCVFSAAMVVFGLYAAAGKLW